MNTKITGNLEADREAWFTLFEQMVKYEIIDLEEASKVLIKAIDRRLAIEANHIEEALVGLL